MKNRGMWRFAMIATLCVLMTVLAVPTAFAASYSKVYGQTQDRVRVREAASTNATIIDNIVKNACVYVTSSKTSGSNTFIQVKYRDSDGDTASGWICQNDGKTTYVKILSADQAKKAFSVSGGNLPSKRVGTFTAAQRKASAKEAENTYIKSGMSSETVKSVQTMLKELKYYSAEITGNVGPKTETAIKSFQRANGLTADGIAGPQTLAKLQAAYNAKGGSSGSTSSSGSSLKLGTASTKVRDLQQDLTTLGYYWAELTGNFGDKTETAVKKFQKDHGLSADGVAGTKTLNAIAAAVAKKGGTASSSSSSGTVLQLDSQGTKVSQLQQNLKTLGYYYAEISGHYGEKTEAAVKKFQSDRGLTADGKAGTKTIAAVEAALEKAGVGASTSGVSGLRLGSSGDKVLALQKDLTTLGFYYGDLTGGFGSLTQQAVRKFQQSKGLTADGIAGTTTLNAIANALKNSGSTSAGGSTSLSTTLRQGDKGEAVTELQTMLKKLNYYYGTISGSFGDLTRKAVRSFQSKNGLTVDGIAGPATLNKLRSLTGGGSTSDNSSSGTTVTSADSYGRLTKNNVYLRSSYSTTSAAKASLAKGTLVRITKTYVSGGVRWYYVSVTQGRYTYHGYIRSDMMETISEADFNAGQGNAGSSDQETLGMIRVTGNNVSLRYQPSTDAQRVSTANMGDVFYYVDTVDGWFQTRQGYWISSQYAKVMTDDEAGDYLGSDERNTYKYNDTGSMVSWIQTALRALGYYADNFTISGRFGSNTEDAVKAYQRAKGLTADGVVGPKTLEALRNDYNGGGSGGDTDVEVGKTIYNLDWFTAKNGGVFSKIGLVSNGKAKLTDLWTGKSLNIQIQSTGSHADVEPATAADTSTFCSIYGVSIATEDTITYKRRPMLLTTSTGHQFVCSIYGTPHGAQKITDNNFPGQFCLHFLNSRTHGSNSVNADHQDAIKKAITIVEGKGATVTTLTSM